MPETQTVGFASIRLAPSPCVGPRRLDPTYKADLQYYPSNRFSNSYIGAGASSSGWSRRYIE
jgi:hypothetical protein